MSDARYFDLYCVAFFKHDAPQVLMAGPFVDACLADDWIAENGHDGHYVVVKTALPFEVWP